MRAGAVPVGVLAQDLGGVVPRVDAEGDELHGIAAVGERCLELGEACA